MRSVLNSNQENASVLPVVCWTSKTNHPSYQEALEIISAWWAEIAGKRVIWEVVTEIGSSPLTYECYIDKTFLSNATLHYYTNHTEMPHLTPVKELYLDLEVQKLTIVVDSSLNVTYRVQPLQEGVCSYQSCRL
jgi:hypothetical protein